MMKRFLFSLLLLAALLLRVEIFSTEISSTPLAADISFLVIDLKFTEDSRVKICEIQPGNHSLFKGYYFVNGADGVIPNFFYEFLTKFQDKIWYIKTDVADDNFKE